MFAFRASGCIQKHNAAFAAGRAVYWKRWSSHETVGFACSSSSATCWSQRGISVRECAKNYLMAELRSAVAFASKHFPRSIIPVLCGSLFILNHWYWTGTVSSRKIHPFSVARHHDAVCLPVDAELYPYGPVWWESMPPNPSRPYTHYFTHLTATILLAIFSSQRHASRSSSFRIR